MLRFVHVGLLVAVTWAATEDTWTEISAGVGDTEILVHNMCPVRVIKGHGKMQTECTATAAYNQEGDHVFGKLDRREGNTLHPGTTVHVYKTAVLDEQDMAALQGNNANAFVRDGVLKDNADMFNMWWEAAIMTHLLKEEHPNVAKIKYVEDDVARIGTSIEKWAHAGNSKSMGMNERQAQHFSRPGNMVVEKLGIDLYKKVFGSEDPIHNYALPCSERMWSYGDVHTTIDREDNSGRRFLLEDDVRPIAAAMVSALKYIHEHHVAHLDATLRNWMISEDGRQLKLIDFGVARSACIKSQRPHCNRLQRYGRRRGFHAWDTSTLSPVYRSDDYTVQTEGRRDVNNQKQYISPELIRNKIMIHDGGNMGRYRYDGEAHKQFDFEVDKFELYQADIWAVGLNVYQLLTGTCWPVTVKEGNPATMVPPAVHAKSMAYTGGQRENDFTALSDPEKIAYGTTNQDISDAVERDLRANLFSAQAANFIRNALNMDPNKRLTAEQLSDHPFVKDFLGRPLTNFAVRSVPTTGPTAAPSSAPTFSPTTAAPTAPTAAPTTAPTAPTAAPTTYAPSPVRRERARNRRLNF